MIEGDMSKEINTIIEYDLIHELKYSLKQVETITDYDDLMLDLSKRIKHLVVIYNDLNAIRKSSYKNLTVNALTDENKN